MKTQKTVNESFARSDTLCHQNAQMSYFKIQLELTHIPVHWKEVTRILTSLVTIQVTLTYVRSFSLGLNQSIYREVLQSTCNLDSRVT